MLGLIVASVTIYLCTRVVPIATLMLIIFVRIIFSENILVITLLFVSNIRLFTIAPLKTSFEPTIPTLAARATRYTNRIHIVNNKLGII